jgi:hypothetical protein
MLIIHDSAEFAFCCIAFRERCLPACVGWGLQNLDILMTNTMQNETAGYEASDMGDTGNFISLVANCIEATNEIGYFAREELQRRS